MSDNEMSAEELDNLNARVAYKMGWRIDKVLGDDGDVLRTDLIEPDGSVKARMWGEYDLDEIGGVPDYTDAPLLVELMLKYQIAVVPVGDEWSASVGERLVFAPTLGLAVCKVVDQV